VQRRTSARFNELLDSALVGLLHMQQQQIEMLNRLVSADWAQALI
jgi:hypothetical protein